MFRKLFKFIKGYEKAAILAPLLVILELVCELLLPKLMANIIDFGIDGGQGIGYIMQKGVLMLLLALISMFAGVSAAK